MTVDSPVSQPAALSPSVPFGDEASARPAYARRFSGPTGAFFLDVQSDALSDLLAPWPEASVLDVGGGHGQVARMMLNSSRDVTVASSLELQETQIATLPHAPNLTFQRHDLTRLPYADQSFDVVVSIRMLAHVADIPAYLTELARLARHAVIVDFARTGRLTRLSNRLFALKKAIEKDTRPFQTQTSAEIIDTLGQHGFGSPELRPQFALPMALHRAVRSAPLSKGSEAALAALGLRRFGSPVLLRMTRNR